MANQEQPPVTTSPFWALVRITRPWNVLMVVVAMLLIKQAWIAPILSAEVLSVNQLNFAFSALVMALLAAGGNVINDYFDIAEDVINKPRRALVGRVISRRKTMAWHIALSGLATGGSIWLSIRMGSPTPFIWCAAVGTLLGGYSPWFKRRFLRGNLIIALTVGQLPFWCLVGMIPVDQWHAFLWTPNGIGLASYAILSAYFTFVREVTKDLQDAEGDRLAHYDTLAVRWGNERTIRLLQVLHAVGWLALLITAAGAVIWLKSSWQIVLFLGPHLGSHVQLTRRQMASVSAWQKLTLAGGLLFLAVL